MIIRTNTDDGEVEFKHHASAGEQTEKGVHGEIGD